MIATQKKLREARFFYDLLVSAEKQIMKQNGEASDFYLSAFLTATRSVSSVLETEEKQRFRPWYKQWKRRLTASESFASSLSAEAKRLASAGDFLSGPVAIAR
jgi:hypothetical protein